MRMIFINIFIVFLFCFPLKWFTQGAYATFMNPLMDIASSHQFPNDNTYLAIGYSCSMNLRLPQTGKMGDSWLYTYDVYRINELKQTHQPSALIRNYHKI